MMRIFFIASLFIFATSCERKEESLDLIGSTLTQCGMDTDCKGDRICESGQCISPPSADSKATIVPNKVSAPTPSPSAESPPKFKDFPSLQKYSGAAAEAKQDIANDKAWLAERMQSDPDFAGEYLILGFGCGMQACIQTYVVNKRTGDVLDTTFQSFSMFDENGNPIYRFGEEVEAYRVDSRLLVTRSLPEDGDANTDWKAHFYLLENGSLKEIMNMPIDKPKDIE